MLPALAALLVLATAAAPPVPAGPAKLAPAEAETLKAAILRDRRQTEGWLKSAPTSYLATVQRKDFGTRTTLTVGGAADNDVVIADAAVKPHHLQVTVAGDSFQVATVDAGATFKVKDAERREARVGPSAVGLGRYTLRLSHQRFPAIIVFDPKSPRYRDYKGLKFFPVDFAYRFQLPLTASPRPETTIILSTRGNQRHAVRLGWFDFTVGRSPCRLEAVRLLEPGVGENDLGVFFTDATSGKQSYPLGRYVDVTRMQSGLYVLDFNTAYNPACAVSDHYNCPYPPKGNRLKVAIRAGEMNAHYH
ncbi:MAG: DUF1684 domain-containing protein [Candidatus Eisenbacteria bacterium]|nr:DUF1684 domain-containing protein [Candidatus Eisenbacteria bacterium]